MTFLGHAVPGNPTQLPAFWRERTTDLLPYNAGAAALAEAFALHLERALQVWAPQQATAMCLPLVSASSEPTDRL